MKYHLLQLIVLFPVLAHAQEIQVVSSTTDLGFFAQVIGADKVSVIAIASPLHDPHFVEARPSSMMKLRRADIALKVGLELDLWLDKLIDGSRNDDIVVVDCSRDVKPIEIPAFKADARYGDLHRYGNPHYWMSPANVPAITQVIVEALCEVSPQHCDEFTSRRDSLAAAIVREALQLKDSAATLAGANILLYHNGWPYFNEYFGVAAAEFIEPYPGVPPSPSHLGKLKALMRELGITVVAVDVYFDHRVAEKLAEETGANVVTIYPSLGGRDPGEDYLGWLRGNVFALREALR
ncbi:MAG TPA: metal ABC transporter substrate-binding protein [candidate division Zixibacteria bacterium]|nr:metal ABC transporter substrate-binding protein [candidate division Zixibacteria bacterium]